MIVTMPDGLNLNIREWGGAGITCVLIHGLAEGGFIWNDFAREMAPYCRLLAIDLRGHGDSDWDTKKSYNFDSYVADVECILDQLGLKNYILIGHSLGGDIVVRIMRNRLNEALGAVLVDTAPISDLEVQKIAHHQIVESYRLYGSIDEYANWLGRKRLLASAPALSQLARDSLSYQSTGGYSLKFDIEVAKILLETYDESWWFPALLTFELPVLIIRGVGSAILSKRIAEQMIKLLPNGNLTEVSFAGHAVINDNPIGFLEAIRPFLSALVTSSCRL